MDFNEETAKQLITKHRLRASAFFRWRKQGYIPELYKRKKVFIPTLKADATTEQTQQALRRLVLMEPSFIKAAALGYMTKDPTRITRMASEWRRGAGDHMGLTLEEGVLVREWMDGLWSVCDNLIDQLNIDGPSAPQEHQRLSALLAYPGISARAICRSMPTKEEDQLYSIAFGKSLRPLSDDLKYQLSQTVLLIQQAIAGL